MLWLNVHAGEYPGCGCKLKENGSAGMHFLSNMIERYFYYFVKKEKNILCMFAYLNALNLNNDILFASCVSSDLATSCCYIIGGIYSSAQWMNDFALFPVSLSKFFSHFPCLFIPWLWFDYSGNWKEVLLKYIDADVLPEYWGGTKKDPDGNPMCPSLVS